MRGCGYVVALAHSAPSRFAECSSIELKAGQGEPLQASVQGTETLAGGKELRASSSEGHPLDEFSYRGDEFGAPAPTEAK